MCASASLLSLQLAASSEQLAASRKHAADCRNIAKDLDDAQTRTRVKKPHFGCQLDWRSKPNGKLLQWTCVCVCVFESEFEFERECCLIQLNSIRAANLVPIAIRDSRSRSPSPLAAPTIRCAAPTQLELIFAIVAWRRATCNCHAGKSGGEHSRHSGNIRRPVETVCSALLCCCFAADLLICCSAALLLCCFAALLLPLPPLLAENVRLFTTRDRFVLAVDAIPFTSRQQPSSAFGRP